jgi:hypothetical protein
VRPEHGGRLELKLTQVSDESARYALTIFLPEREVTTDVLVQITGGTIELGAWQGVPPPAWLEAVARALLRTVWRSATSDGDWPRRVTRWRPEPKP